MSFREPTKRTADRTAADSTSFPPCRRQASASHGGLELAPARVGILFTGQSREEELGAGFQDPGRERSAEETDQGGRHPPVIERYGTGRELRSGQTRRAGLWLRGLQGAEPKTHLRFRYGQSGPYSRNPGYDVNIEAEAGLMHITGEPDGPPVKVGVAITDLTTGLYVKSAILAALLSRGQTNEGVHIDANLFDSQIVSLANIASNYLITGQEAKRQGTSHPSIVPYQVFETGDGFIMIGAGNDSQFRKFSTILSRPDWVTDDRYSTNSARVAHRSTLVPLITSTLSEHPTSYWLDKFQGQGFPFAPVNDIKATFEHPQTVARDLVREVEHPRAGKIKLVAPAIMYNGHRMEVRCFLSSLLRTMPLTQRHPVRQFTKPPPVLRQHSVEILRELGYSDEQIAELQQKNVV
ncbi:SPOSA6832_01620, partial [Sporobolomyces salmonicolor]